MTIGSVLERAPLPPRPPRLPLRPALPLLLARILITSRADLAAQEGAGVVAFRLALQQRREALAGFGDGFRRKLAGDRFFGAADGHFVEVVLAEQRWLGGLGDVAAHVVEVGFGEEGGRGCGFPLIRPSGTFSPLGRRGLAAGFCSTLAVSGLATAAFDGAGFVSRDRVVHDGEFGGLEAFDFVAQAGGLFEVEVGGGVAH